MRVQLRLLLLALYILLAACKQNSAHDNPGNGGGNEPRSTQEGPGNGGGGDPRVAAFLDAAGSACTWMQRESDLSSKASACRTELADLTASVNDLKRVARVYSDDLPALNNGVPKDAVTDLKSRRVHINIARWEGESNLEQEVTAAMEMALLLEIPDRYTLGKRLTSELAASVAKGSPEELETFQKWAYTYIDASHTKNKDGSPFLAIKGQTDDHLACSLFITDNHREFKDIYLSLGVGPDLEHEVIDSNNYYIGGHVTSDKADLRMTSHEINFRSIDYETVGHETNGSPIAKFSDRRLLIELSNGGQVFRVTGTSSMLGHSVVCNIKM